MYRRARLAPLLACLLGLAALPAAAQDTLFSGPQPGEKTPGFRVKSLTGDAAGTELDPLAAWKGAPSVLIFVHAVERSMAPLMTTLDQYAFENRAKLQGSFVFLTDDRVAAEMRIPLIARSLQLRLPAGISVDGPEGPGSYALNRKCLLTIVAGRDNKATASFALVQPGIADAPKVLAALSQLIGDANPPTAESLLARRRAGSPRTDAAPARPAANQDLSTMEGLRAAVQALQAEVRRLTEEVAQLRRQQPGDRPMRPMAAGNIPGAAPTDERLLGLLRSFIQPTNDPATVDRVVREVEDYIKGKPDLRKQALDGWVRVLFLKYGTEYAQMTGQKLVDRLKQ